MNNLTQHSTAEAIIAAVRRCAIGERVGVMDLAENLKVDRRVIQKARPVAELLVADFYIGIMGGYNRIDVTRQNDQWREEVRRDMQHRRKLRMGTRSAVEMLKRVNKTQEVL